MLAIVVESRPPLFSRRRIAAMSSGLPNSDQEPAADAITSEVERKAVETFTLDVSAGNRTGAASRPKHRALTMRVLFDEGER